MLVTKCKLTLADMYLCLLLMPWIDFFFHCISSSYSCYAFQDTSSELDQVGKDSSQVSCFTASLVSSFMIHYSIFYQLAFAA